MGGILPECFDSHCKSLVTFGQVVKRSVGAVYDIIWTWWVVPSRPHHAIYFTHVRPIATDVAHSMVCVYVGYYSESWASDVNKVSTKDLTFKAKVCTKNSNFVLKDSQGPKPRIISLLWTLQKRLNRSWAGLRSAVVYLPLCHATTPVVVLPFAYGNKNAAVTV